jgi:hypothetical protein
MFALKADDALFARGPWQGAEKEAGPEDSAREVGVQRQTKSGACAEAARLHPSWSNWLVDSEVRWRDLIFRSTTWAAICPPSL